MNSTRLLVVVVYWIMSYLESKNKKKQPISSYKKKMIPSGIEPLIPALLAPCLNQLGQGIRSLHLLLETTNLKVKSKQVIKLLLNQ